MISMHVTDNVLLHEVNVIQLKLAFLLNSIEHFQLFCRERGGCILKEHNSRRHFDRGVVFSVNDRGVVFSVKSVRCGGSDFAARF